MKHIQWNLGIDHGFVIIMDVCYSQERFESVHPRIARARVGGRRIEVG